MISHLPASVRSPSLTSLSPENRHVHLAVLARLARALAHRDEALLPSLAPCAQALAWLHKALGNGEGPALRLYDQLYAALAAMPHPTSPVHGQVLDWLNDAGGQRLVQATAQLRRRGRPRDEAAAMHQIDAMRLPPATSRVQRLARHAQQALDCETPPLAFAPLGRLGRGSSSEERRFREQVLLARWTALRLEEQHAIWPSASYAFSENDPECVAWKPWDMQMHVVRGCHKLTQWVRNSPPAVGELNALSVARSSERYTVRRVALVPSTTAAGLSYSEQLQQRTTHYTRRLRRLEELGGPPRPVALLYDGNLNMLEVYERRDGSLQDLLAAHPNGVPTAVLLHVARPVLFSLSRWPADAPALLRLGLGDIAFNVEGMVALAPRDDLFDYDSSKMMFMGPGGGFAPEPEFMAPVATAATSMLAFAFTLLELGLGRHADTQALRTTWCASSPVNYAIAYDIFNVFVARHGKFAEVVIHEMFPLYPEHRGSAARVLELLHWVAPNSGDAAWMSEPALLAAKCVRAAPSFDALSPALLNAMVQADEAPSSPS